MSAPLLTYYSLLVLTTIYHHLLLFTIITIIIDLIYIIDLFIIDLDHTHTYEITKFTLHGAGACVELSVSYFSPPSGRVGRQRPRDTTRTHTRSEGTVQRLPFLPAHPCCHPSNRSIAEELSHVILMSFTNCWNRSDLRSWSLPKEPAALWSIFLPSASFAHVCFTTFSRKLM